MAPSAWLAGTLGRPARRGALRSIPEALPPSSDPYDRGHTISLDSRPRAAVVCAQEGSTMTTTPDPQTPRDAARLAEPDLCRFRLHPEDAPCRGRGYCPD